MCSPSARSRGTGRPRLGHGPRGPVTERHAGVRHSVSTAGTGEAGDRTETCYASRLELFRPAFVAVAVQFAHGLQRHPGPERFARLPVLLFSAWWTWGNVTASSGVAAAGWCASPRGGRWSSPPAPAAGGPLPGVGRTVGGVRAVPEPSGEPLISLVGTVGHARLPARDRMGHSPSRCSHRWWSYVHLGIPAAQRRSGVRPGSGVCRLTQGAVVPHLSWRPEAAPSQPGSTPPSRRPASVIRPPQCRWGGCPAPGMPIPAMRHAA